MVELKKYILPGLVITTAILFGCLYYRRRSGLTGQQFNADTSTSDGIRVNVLPYNGKYRNDPELRRVHQQLPGLVQAAVRRIKQYAKTPEPDMVVNIKFDDSFDDDVFIKPSLASSCPPRPYAPGKGNCKSYTIEVGTKALVNKYRNRTDFSKMLTHELVHMWMLYTVKDHDRLPDYIIEGVPIHIAGQEQDILRAHSENGTSDGNAYNYSDNEIPVTEYSRIIRDFRTKGYIPI